MQKVKTDYLLSRERVLNSTNGGGLEELNVGGLQPGTEYEIRVVANNDHGAGEPSKTIKVRNIKNTLFICLSMQYNIFYLVNVKAFRKK